MLGRKLLIEKKKRFIVAPNENGGRESRFLKILKEVKLLFKANLMVSHSIYGSQF